MGNTIIYILIFIIGTLFGSFSTLAVYRLPLHQDITHKRSYCPNCSHKLKFLDMIPILSYLFLGGKCRYCKNKIRIRYLLLEILTGTIFLLFTLSLKINIYNIHIDKIAYLIVGILYLSGIIIIAGIDKEKRQINKPVLVYEIVILSIYMIYLYIVEKANIYRYVIYLMTILVLFLLDTIMLKKENKNNYTIHIVILSIIQAIFTGGYEFLISTIIGFILIFIKTLIMKINNNVNKNCKILPIGYYMIIGNIITIIIINYFAIMGD